MNKKNQILIATVTAVSAGLLTQAASVAWTPNEILVTGIAIFCMAIGHYITRNEG